MRQPLSLPEPPPRTHEAKGADPSAPSGRALIRSTVADISAATAICEYKHGHASHPTLIGGITPLATLLPEVSAAHPRAFFVVHSNTSSLRTSEGVSTPISARRPPARQTPSRSAAPPPTDITLTQMVPFFATLTRCVSAPSIGTLDAIESYYSLAEARLKRGGATLLYRSCQVHPRCLRRLHYARRRCVRLHQGRIQI